MKIYFTTALLLIALTGFCQVQTGKASFYADKFEGRPTASGEKYKHNKLTAAHKTLPFGTKVKVTNTANNESVEVVINDRGPYVDGRIIDLSRSAAEKLGFINQGLADVKVEVVDAGDGKSISQGTMVSNVSVNEREFYDLSISRATPKGFGIQIGTYQELVNLMRLADNLKSSYKKSVSVQVKVVNGVKFYSLILGDFGNRPKATQFLDKVKKKFPDAFIVDYSKL
ncbi:MAG: septal ring lytic transglycosylase RlpA family protein [Cyclobacteriaceae bacterium]